MDLEFIRLDREAIPPLRAYKESAAWDLSAFLLNDAGRPMTKTLAPRSTTIIPTGLVLRAPDRHFLQICSRSGLATRSIFVSNAPGIIDPDYTGGIFILLYNGGLEPHYVKHGDRIAQALILPLVSCQLEERTKFTPTERGDRGLGSTGE